MHLEESEQQLLAAATPVVLEWRRQPRTAYEDCRSSSRFMLQQPKLSLNKPKAV